ncbi:MULTISPECIES: NUDIX hydrolase [unclassified Clostridioides]|uniref:NUDIX hydrolase n=1 Tax=unclassified Clostridioides TaxID=2635829 RepID=UPI001D11E78C|nr:NUDIX hydrolase [Clostridioides sp. ZZV15-6388]MCC0646394.1 NUDIX hydrolase [Clostridioides sp. ZZV14-6150]MCC0659059.1 NUDIX hydrolase [Clostridioides sp. ZZV14-6154]MCC0665717.1 NUDIX hydrolase [Clostridioides sp. ZZV15-6597]MCC0668523.1 NUDIX hydrolase [Clostridioides sp. ZZV14-6153]MCC0719546.1 NUDIX hydrolase [Clostridioides sp. ZZV14-6105]MCC0722385.1 NUDIX hydrolase [Clostridioides sp. ZZV14-6104]MCC0724917.1 NUDIX hydrolase [Clostridioides sp. ZZV14-6045]MCC0730711.1 NUDIX hydrol
MKKTIIKNINPLVESKFMGLFEIEYKNKLDEDKVWMVASRKSSEQLKSIYLENKADSADAVAIVGLHKSSKKLILIKQFRVPINGYIYELPAGLIDKGESIDISVERELREETGLTLLEIQKNKSNEKVYLSPGMSDESIAFVYCICDGNITDEFLEPDEDIEAILVSQDEAKEILQSNHKIDTKAFLILQMFVSLGTKLFE